MRRTLKSLFVTAALVAMCATASAIEVSPEDALKAAEAKWTANKPKAYEFRINFRFCCVIRLTGPIPQWPVFHADDDTASVVSGDPALAAGGDIYSTVEKQFAFIQSKLAKRPYRVEIEYDPDCGYPRHVYMKMFEHAADDEYGFDIQGFTVRAR